MSTAQWVDRRNARRTAPLQVLCLGISRSGTSSMKQALETLGYDRTNHGLVAFANPHDRKMWVEAINAKFFGKGRLYVREDWDRLLGHFQAVTDAPHYLFAKELIEAYPDAKVVLTIRDPDSWWRSTNATIARPRGFLRHIHGWLDPDIRAFQELVNLIFSAFYGTDKWRGNEQLCKAQFIAHYEYVRSLVPSERLLEFDVKQGWGPLCSFLGKDIPREPFPRLFDRVAFQTFQKSRDFKAVSMLFVIFAPLLVAAFALIVYFRMASKH
ncbi:P-loop containing nucleoside triphosphate hydrolase protein [Mycena filopes]|nr:P-loop containing nucleoside triphosphate hydrolase protein [Mycena filopes]